MSLCRSQCDCSVTPLEGPTLTPPCHLVSPGPILSPAQNNETGPSGSPPRVPEHPRPQQRRTRHLCACFGFVCFFPAKGFVSVSSSQRTGSGWLKGCRVVSGRGSGRSHIPGDTEGPLGSAGSCRARGRDSGPARGGQPAEVSQVVTHLLDELHLLTQEVAPQEVLELRVCAGRTRAHKSPRARVRPCSRAPAASRRPECHPLVVGWPPHILEEGSAASPPQEPLGALGVSWATSGKKEPRPPGPQPRGGDRSPERGGCGQVADAGWLGGGRAPGCHNSDEPRCSQLLGSRGLRSKTSAGGLGGRGWPRWL